MSTSIIILAQHDELFKQCLSRILLYTEGDYELIVINDGASKDVARRIMKDMKVITTPELRGVAAGFNQGAAAAAGEYIVFIRDHMQVYEGWLDKLTACLERHEKAAMAGPMSNDVSGIQRLPLPAGASKQPDNAAQAFIAAMAGRSQKVTRLLSSLLIVRREAFRQLGGFDERFGLESYEDDDFCYRALQAGYGLYVAQDCFARFTPPPSLFPEDPGWYGRLLDRNKTAAMEKWGFDLSTALHAWKWPVTVSLCMIVKDEQDTLDRCLSSVHDLVDEIVIVDTGSTDRTKEIASAYTDKIVDFVWVNDFSKARNFAFSHATKDYILWLDADDVLLEADRFKLKELAAALEWNTDSVSMHYNLSFDEAGNVSTSLRRNRLVKRDRQFRWIGIVHEYLEVSGKVLYSDICITHDRVHTNSTRNLHIFESRQAAGDIFSARDTFYFANELADNRHWERAIAVYEQFLRMSDGWVEDKIRACGRAADCYMELDRAHEAKKRATESFAYAAPRAEICCKLGTYFMKELKYDEAIFWYKLALQLPKPSEPNAIVQHACWTWLPHLNLCVCYDKLGQYKLAYTHNEEAAKFVPNDSRIVGNRSYFQQAHGLGESTPIA